MDSVTSPALGHLGCVERSLHPPAAHTAFVGMDSVKSRCWRALMHRAWLSPLLRVAAAAHRDAGGAPALCDSQTCFGGSKTRSTAAHPMDPHARSIPCTPPSCSGRAMRVTRTQGIFSYDNFYPFLFLSLQRAVPMLKNFLVSEQADFPSLQKQQMEGNKHFSSGEVEV